MQAVPAWNVSLDECNSPRHNRIFAAAGNRHVAPGAELADKNRAYRGALRARIDT